MNPIKLLRQAAGMNQTDFGRYFGIPRRTIQGWEYGERNCPEYLLELMKYKLEKEGLLSNDRQNCLICKHSVSEASEDGRDILHCFECSGHEGEDVVVLEDGCCPNFN